MSTHSVAGSHELGKTGSLGFLAGLLLLGGLLSHVWVTQVLPPFNSEHLGCDACHHALMIHALSLPDAAEGAFVAGPYASYPHLSHQLAAWLMPLVENDAYKAMRLVSMAGVLGLLAVQYHLFRRVFSAAASLLVLLLWQYLGALTRTNDLSYFMHAYFFAQGVGEWFLWLAIVCVCYPTCSPLRQSALTGVSIVLALAAYGCHLVPGVIALGGLGLVLLIRLTDRPRWLTVLALGVLGLAGVAVLLGSDQLAHMQGCKSADGSTPFRQYPLILLWVPTVVAASVLTLHRLRRGAKGELDTLMTTLSCFLLIGGLLTGYTAYEWAVRGTTAAYGVVKFFFFQFSAASMLWLVWLGHFRATRQHGPENTPPAPLLAAARWRSGWAVGGGMGAVVLAALIFGRFAAYELRQPAVADERNPAKLAARLHAMLPPYQAAAPDSSRGSAIFYDPQLPQSSVFVNMVGLRRSFHEAYQVSETLSPTPPNDRPAALQRLRRQVPFTRLITPEEVGYQRGETATVSR